MANTALIKRSSVANKAPTTSDLSLGELAVNTYDGKLFLKKSVGGTESIVDLTNADKLDGQDGSYYTGYTDTAISNLINSAPATLDTLSEIASALNNDAALNTTLTNAIATKLPLTGGTLTGNLKIVSDTLKLFLGASEEMQVFHDGTSSLIKDTRNNGKVRIQADNFDFIDKDASGVILSATSSGLNITGTCTATTFSGSGASLTNIPAAQLTGVLPALDGSNLTGVVASGTNANTLDNLDSTQFLRSDANDTTSGKLHLTYTNTYPLDINGSDDGKIVLQGSSNPYIRFREGTSDKAYMQWSSNGNFYIVNQYTGEHIYIGTGSTGLRFVHDGTTSTVWHSGNDGTGSGLDSDLWDGNQFASYLDQAVLTSSTVNFARVNVTGSHGMNNDGWFRNTTSGEGLYNNATTQHFYSDDDDYWNIAGGTAANGLRFRDEHNGTIRGYVYANNSNQVGFLNQSGSWTVRTETNGITKLGSNGYQLVNGNNNRNLKYISGDTGSGNDIGISGYNGNGDWRFQLYGTGGSYGFLDANWASWDIKKNVNGQFQVDEGSGLARVWNANNDGSGSTLDADTVDGLQASSFIRSDTDDTTSGHLTLSDSGYSISDDYHIWKRTYSVNGSNPKELLDKDGNSLADGGAYRFTAHISATGTDNSARAVYWNQNGTWKLNVTYQSGTSSNHPEFILNNGVPTIHIDHSSTYSIHVLGERLELGEGTGTDNRSGFGTDGYFSSTPSDLRYNPDGSGAIGSGNVVFHGGNDGSGSGLDADKLDGQEGSYYLDYNNFSNTPTIPSAVTNNNQLTNGAGYITSADGGNAATVGTLSASQFIRSDDSDSITKGSMWVLTNSIADWGFRFSNGNATQGHVYMSHGSYGMHIRNDSSTTSHYLLDVYASNGNRLQVRGGDAYTTIAGNAVWHAGNDGSGSGLSADNVDGLDVHTGRNDEANKIVRTQGNGYIQAGWIDTTSGDTGTGSDCTRF